MTAFGNDSLNTRRTLIAAGKSFDYFSLEAAAEAGLGNISKLPFSLKVLLENLLRWEDGRTVTVEDIKGIASWLDQRRSDREIAYRPARVLMQDFTGVPAVVDLAAMRDAMVAMGGDPQKINPLSPVDLVIDHSVMIDFSGTIDAEQKNEAMEFERNQERYEFLRWGQAAFKNFRVVPPGTGICHQVNLEYLAKVIWTGGEDNNIAYPDTLVGTDSHTTMVNGMAVLGWGVGGIEAEAAMLGQPVSMLIPEVIGFKLNGQLSEGITATDLVLRIVEMLRGKGVVGKFVEFYGEGINNLSLPDRATIANMAPEYGATCGFFPIDQETLNYLALTSRDDDQIALVKEYAKKQGMWRDIDTPDPAFTDTLELDISTIEASISGPKRPQDRISLNASSVAFKDTLKVLNSTDSPRNFPVEGTNYELTDGDVVIAAITSCTNTSNPSVLVAAGLLARNAVVKGLKSKPWVKTSFAPGSQVVVDYLESADLQKYLNSLGFNIAGFGCTTCIGNSGPLAKPIAEVIDKNDLVVTAVLSGNRNFEGRISPHVKANYLASPPLVVAYAIAGSMTQDLINEPLGHDDSGNPIHLRDIWPNNNEITTTISKSLTPAMFNKRYANVSQGPKAWQEINIAKGETYNWQPGSTYIQRPTFFDKLSDTPAEISDITHARSLAILGDSVTTDHISPAGGISPDGPAGTYLTSHQVAPKDFNSYGSRRGNHKIMMRGTFANIRIRNEMAPGTEGGVTRHIPSGKIMNIFDAAERYAEESTALIVIGGKEYGTGSSRDWAAKGTRLLGVKAVIVESFERIHRSNLVGMGVLPLQFEQGITRETLKLDGSEQFDLLGISSGIKPGMGVDLHIHRTDGTSDETTLICRIDTLDEVEYLKAGGILQFVLKNINNS